MKKVLCFLLLIIFALCLTLSGCGKKKQQVENDIISEGEEQNLDSLLDDWPPESNTLEGIILVGQVLSDSVNVRQSPSTSSNSLGKVSRGDLLLVLKSGTTEGSGGGSWYEVRFNGQSAYIHNDYLSAREMASDSIILIGSVVNVDSVLNIRAEPNTQSQRVGRANLGDKFVVLNQGAGDGSWSKIEYVAGGTEDVASAYVKSEFLKVVQQMVINLLLP
ncbi:MAG: SH3 domain-containing protein [Clostridiales bacterium]|nr:SH3 domain-containing protein [Clostridiales bacterium]